MFCKFLLRRPLLFKEVYIDWKRLWPSITFKKKKPFTAFIFYPHMHIYIYIQLSYSRLKTYDYTFSSTSLIRNKFIKSLVNLTLRITILSYSYVWIYQTLLFHYHGCLNHINNQIFNTLADPIIRICSFWISNYSDRWNSIELWQ